MCNDEIDNICADTRIYVAAKARDDKCTRDDKRARNDARDPSGLDPGGGPVKPCLMALRG